MSEKIPQSHSKEIILPDVQLKIREPDGDKNFMVTFNAKTKLESDIFGWAVNKVLKDAGLNPFHQIQGDGERDGFTGYNGYEVWKTIDRQTLEVLLPKIQAEALRYIRDYTSEGELEIPTERPFSELEKEMKERGFSYAGEESLTTYKFTQDARFDTTPVKTKEEVINEIVEQYKTQGVDVEIELVDRVMSEGQQAVHIFVKPKNA